MPNAVVSRFFGGPPLAVLLRLVLLCVLVGIILHVYAALFWVRGSLRAMTRGTVSRAWARHHHPLWYRRMTGGNAE